MIKNTIKWLLVPGFMLGVGVVLAVLGSRPAQAELVAHTVMPLSSPISSASPVVASPDAGNPAVLDARRRLALGMIETGNKDNEIGGAGEVSRYQIMPSVWKQYSHSQDYQDPSVSLAVAQLHWTRLYASFQKQAHRNPTDFDMYVLWNTHYGYYAGKGFNPNRLSFVVRDRAQRFVNLVQCTDL